MSFDQIMDEITSGLTGDRDHDIPFLREQAEKHKDHEMAQEILRACGRLLFKYLTDEQKGELGRVVENHDLGYESVMEEVRFKIFQKKYGEALVLMEDLVEKVEKSGLFTDDRVSEYHCFDEFFEEALYRYFQEPEKTIRRASLRFDTIYLQYGSLLMDMKRYEDAQKALATAMRWNPASADIAFEHAETYKVMGDIDTFFHLTVDAFRYAFRPQQVARCLRNLGYYFVEKALWREAASCYAVSLQYDNESKQAMSELYYIQQKAGDVGQASAEEMRTIAEKYGFPLGPHDDVLGLAYSYGKHFCDEKDADGARYCLTIVYELTGADEIKQMIDALPGEGQHG